MIFLVAKFLFPVWNLKKHIRIIPENDPLNVIFLIARNLFPGHGNLQNRTYSEQVYMIPERDLLNVIFLTARSPFPGMEILKDMLEFIPESDPLNVIFQTARSPFPSLNI